MWPNNCRCAVGFSFDFDAESLWLGSFRQEHPVILSRGEYGARVGIGRILNLLNKYDLKATFFVPGLTAEMHPDKVEAIHAAGHEIGHHGYRHENTHHLDLENEQAILDKGIECLKKITGQVPKGYRTPAGLPGPNTFRLLVDLDFIYDSSMMAQDEPYLYTVEGRGRQLLEIPFHWELDDFPHFAFNTRPYYSGLSAPSKVYEIWADEFDVCYQEGGYFGLTMHPQVMGKRHRMKLLEKLILHMLDYPGVWFAQHIEIANWWLRK